MTKDQIFVARHFYVEDGKTKMDEDLEKYLKENNLWIRGDRLTSKRADIQKSQTVFQVSDGPFIETKELTGFFLYRAENMAQATELSKGCPSLLHDSLSLYEMEGDRT